MTTTTEAAAPTVRDRWPARRSARYVRHRLFWVSSALFAVFLVIDTTGPDKWGSTTLSGLDGRPDRPVRAGDQASLTRSSDRAAEAAGAVSTSQRTRTLALAGRRGRAVHARPRLVRHGGHHLSAEPPGTAGDPVRARF
jgi:hypothetical protein